MNAILSRIQLHDEEPTLYDVIGLLEQILTHVEFQSEGTRKLRERISQMAYEMGREKIADRRESLEIQDRFSSVESEILLVKNHLRKDKINMKSLSVIPT
jgi:hypothetical protein